MPESNYNIIKPVEGLQSLTGVNPVGQRRQRRQKQNPPGTSNTDESSADDTSEDEDSTLNDKSSKYRMDFKA
jgi:hypothetical protein